MPPNWAQSVKNLTEKATKEHYELAKMWLFPDPELGDMLMPEWNPANHNKSDKTPSEQETSPIAMSHQVCSLLVLSPHLAWTFSALLCLEFLNKIISQTL